MSAELAQEIECLDINGVPVADFLFNSDGTVLGVLENVIGDVATTAITTSNLSYACCTANGWTFDPTDTKCYWSASCLSGGTYHIVLDPEGTTGGLFQVDTDEIGSCYLELKFKFLLRVDCQRLTGSLKTFLENIHLQVAIEKVGASISPTIPESLEEIARKDLFKIDDIHDFFRDNTNTGIILNDVEVISTTGFTSQIPRTCEQLYNQFVVDLNTGLSEDQNSEVLNDLSLDSDWYEFSFIISNPTLLQAIYNERLKVSIIGNTLKDFAILLDNVELNKVCREPILPPYFDVDCPTFDLKRIIDNKKSWVNNVETATRIFDLDRRETQYDINHEKLSINTKEVDLALTPAQAIENDIIATITANDCLLAPASGCTSGSTSHECIDLRPLITTEIVDNDDLINILIDAKNRKTLSAYPTLELLYHRYRTGLEHCGVNTNPLDIDSVNAFLELIGTYWSDLIEQVVPATTIWGSTVTTSDSTIIGGANKFVYRKGTMYFCSGGPDYPVPSPASGEVKRSVTIQDITDNQIVAEPAPVTCTAISVRQVNCGSEFLGTITINGLGGTDPTPTGSTISITETIGDECNKAADC